MIDNEFVEKGNYTHTSIDGYIALKQYIFTKKDGKRCLLFRFVNDSVHTVNAFEFVLTQLSGDGRVLGRSRIKYTSLSIPGGGVYVPERGIAVHNSCTDFRIRLVSFVQGVYKYTVKGGRAVAHYDPRGYRAPRKRKNAYSDVEVRSILGLGRKFFALLAVIALIFIAVSSFTAKYRTSNSLSEQTYLSSEFDN